MQIPIDSKIYVAHMPAPIEAALLTRLKRLGFNSVTVGEKLDLQDKNAVMDFFEEELPDYVFLSAANLYNITEPFQPATWLHDNLTSVANVIEVSYRYDVIKLLCIDWASTFLQPMILPWYVETFQASQLDSTLRACQLTRSAITELCHSYRVQYGCDFVSVVTSNVYGVASDDALQTSHLVPTLMQEVVLAKEHELGHVRLLAGAEQRHDLLHIDDLTTALLFLMAQTAQSDCVSVESGQGYNLRELAAVVKTTVGYTGIFDFAGPGPFAALLDKPHAQPLQSAGWHSGISLAEGLTNEYRWYMRHRQY